MAQDIRIVAPDQIRQVTVTNVSQSVALDVNIVNAAFSASVSIPATVTISSSAGSPVWVTGAISTNVTAAFGAFSSSVFSFGVGQSVDFVVPPGCMGAVITTTGSWLAGQGGVITYGSPDGNTYALISTFDQAGDQIMPVGITNWGNYFITTLAGIQHVKLYGGHLAGTVTGAIGWTAAPLPGATHVEGYVTIQNSGTAQAIPIHGDVAITDSISLPVANTVIGGLAGQFYYQTGSLTASDPNWLFAGAATVGNVAAMSGGYLYISPASGSDDSWGLFETVSGSNYARIPTPSYGTMVTWFGYGAINPNDPNGYIFQGARWRGDIFGGLTGAAKLTVTYPHDYAIGFETSGSDKNVYAAIWVSGTRIFHQGVPSAAQHNFPLTYAQVYLGYDRIQWYYGGVMVASTGANPLVDRNMEIAEVVIHSGTTVGTTFTQFYSASAQAYVPGAIAPLQVTVVSGSTTTITGTVYTAPAQSANVTMNSYSLNSASLTVLSANTNRVGATLANQSKSFPIYVRLGTSASFSSFNVRVPPNGYYETPFGYTGLITAACSGTNTATAMVGEATP